MSIYKETIALSEPENDKTKVLIEFTDDMGRDYYILLDKWAAFEYYEQTKGQPAEWEESDYRNWARRPNAHSLPGMVIRYINASFMEWREIVELENPN